MKIMITAIVALLVGAMLAGALVACTHHRRHSEPEKHAAHLVEKLSSDLQLDAEQAAKLDALKAEIVTARKGMSTHREETHASIKRLLAGPNLDQARVLAMVEEHTQAMRDKAPRVVAVVAGFYDSLNAEQQQTLREKIENHMAHRGRFCRHH